MTLYFAPICVGCANFIEFVPPTPEQQEEAATLHAQGRDFEARSVPHARCKAFPDDIPLEIMTSERDHRKRIAGDHGIQYEPKDDCAKQYAEMLFSIPNDGEDDA